MRTAIQDTHVTLNMVRNPNIILIPSKLIILKEPIPGYNNVLQNPAKNMKFGINGKFHCFSEVKKTPKKILGSRDTPIEHLDTLSDNDKKKKQKVSKTTTVLKQIPQPHSSSIVSPQPQNIPLPPLNTLVDTKPKLSNNAGQIAAALIGTIVLVKVGSSVPWG